MNEDDLKCFNNRLTTAKNLLRSAIDSTNPVSILARVYDVEQYTKPQPNGFGLSDEEADSLCVEARARANFLRVSNRK